MVGEPSFKLHDIVETVKGAKFWGEIIAFDSDPERPGCTVMAIAPDFAGTKHVYPLGQLQLRAAPAAGAEGWIAENGRGDLFRRWSETGPGWTNKRSMATRYARREDAEAVHAGDEDAWRIVPFAPARAGETA